MGTSISRLFIIAPAYNEADSLTAFVQEIQRVHKTHFSEIRMTVVVVNDGSSDGTGAMIDELVLRSSGTFQISGIHLTRRFGHQGALNAGLFVAYSKADSESLFVLMDADL